jgi:hypothetical protein
MAAVLAAAAAAAAAAVQGQNSSKASNQQDAIRTDVAGAQPFAVWLPLTCCMVLLVGRCMARLGDPEVVLEAGLVLLLLLVVVAAVVAGQGRCKLPGGSITGPLHAVLRK